MPAVIYRLFRLAWRYRRLVALGLTVFAGLFERHRERIPGPLQRFDPGKIPGVKPRVDEPAPKKS